MVSGFESNNESQLNEIGHFFSFETSRTLPTNSNNGLNQCCVRLLRQMENICSGHQPMNGLLIIRSVTQCSVLKLNS